MSPLLMNRIFDGVANFEELRAGFESIEGSIDAVEGFALFHLAKYGPARFQVKSVA
jgi:hypothetical protein